MKLTIDIGNTQAKAAVFENSRLMDFFSFQELNIKEIEKIFKARPQIKASIISSVINSSLPLIDYLKMKTQCIEFSKEIEVPVASSYETPESLGSDRLANAVGANLTFPGSNVLAVDLGTCIKYDIVNSHNVYEGGAISPGLEMRYKALHEYTAKLPLLKPTGMKVMTGRSSQGSITSGVENGIVAEINGMIENYRSKYSDLKVVLTGGDLSFFKNRLSEKNSIFADPLLLMKGLNKILDHNI